MTLRTRSHEYKFESRFASTQTYEDTFPLFFFLNFISMSAFIIFHKKAKGNWYPQCRSSLSPPKESSF